MEILTILSIIGWGIIIYFNEKKLYKNNPKRILTKEEKIAKDTEFLAKLRANAAINERRYEGPISYEQPHMTDEFLKEIYRYHGKK